jgi:hypothetical protein
VEGFEGAFSYDLGAWFDRSWEVRPEVQVAWLTRYEDEVTGEDLLHVSDLHLAAALTVSNPGDFFVRVQASNGARSAWRTGGSARVGAGTGPWPCASSCRPAFNFSSGGVGRRSNLSG